MWCKNCGYGSAVYRPHNNTCLQCGVDGIQMFTTTRPFKTSTDRAKGKTKSKKKRESDEARVAVEHAESEGMVDAALAVGE